MPGSHEQKEMLEQMEDLRASDADLQSESNLTVSREEKETKKKIEPIQESDAVPQSDSPKPFRFVPLKMGGGGRTHVVSEGSRSLIVDEGISLKDLMDLTERFYELAFNDKTLDKFIRSHNDPHGARFAKWIHQKLSGSNVWDADRVRRGRHAPVHDRTSAHVAAWYSPKRPSSERGEHFKLDECRVWMRLHFWALRKSGLMEKSPSFADYYVRFIAHFVRVYESSAPQFARDSLRWSADPRNVEEYIRNGREMKDVLNINFMTACSQIPESELDDEEWPYNQTP